MKNVPQLIGAICDLMTCLFTEPEKLRIWFKFDVSSICNAACINTTFRVHGKPTCLPPGRGIYRNWGYVFNKKDVISFPQGVKVSNARNEWTLIFWTILPPVDDDNRKPKTLIQSVEGKGAYFQIDEVGNKMGVIDEFTGSFIDSGIDL